MGNKLKYRIGLDIGIASVGWAVLEHDENDNPKRIVDLGVRVFDPAENPKDGTSLAVDRRVARGTRRRLRRRAFRIDRMRQYLTEHLLDNKSIVKEHNLNVYELRNKGLDEKLTNEELYYVIVHFTKHRGFKSNRKSDKSAENGKVLNAINANKEKMQQQGYRTIGEMIVKSDDYFTINPNTGTKEYFVRNHGDYSNCFLRADLQFELETILTNQCKLGNTKITSKFTDDVLEIFNSQRSFDDGPNDPSPYKSNFNVGYCTFEKDEKRAPKGTFSFEYFNALQKINNLKVYSSGLPKYDISTEMKQSLIGLIFKKGELKYSDIRKSLNMPIEYKFSNLSYSVKKNKDENKVLTQNDIIKNAEKQILCKFDKTKQYAKILGVNLSKENKDLFNAIGIVLSYRKSDDKRTALFNFKGNDNLFLVENVPNKIVSALKDANLSQEQIDKLNEIDTSKFGNLSIKAIDKINAYLEDGLTYDKACERAGYDFNKVSCGKQAKIKWVNLTEQGTNELQEITSPVVLRSVSQTIKVINAIINKYGSPCAIYVELAREIAMTRDERNKLDKKMKERQVDNEKYIKELKELGITNPTGQDIVKYRLYLEQGGKCAYSLKSFESVLGSVSNVFKDNNTQVDHIMPYSKCYDDSYNNKVLVLADENQKKGNRVPKEYMTDAQWQNFESWVKVNYANNNKKQARLLLQSSDPANINELNERALNDTKQTSRFILNMLRNHLIFAESSLSKKPVVAVNGAITSYLRKIWGITKIRFESDRHHALDACVIACANDRTIQKLTKYEQYKSIARAKQRNVLILENNYYIDKYTKEKISKEEYNNFFAKWESEYDLANEKINLITAPWNDFKKELEIRLNENVCKEIYKQDLQLIGYTDEELNNVKPIFVSRMPTRKVLGPIHKDTIKRLRFVDDKNVIVKKTSLSNLKLDKNYEIENYAEFAKQSDPLLYNALKQQLIKFKGNGKDAFKDKFYKPVKLKDGTIVNGNEVKTVKIQESNNSFVVLDEKLNKVADKSSMVRIDIFKKDGKNYIVPIYVSDVYKQTLPNVAVPYKNNLVMDDKDFAFSLYPNDLVYMEKLNGTFKGHYAESKSENSGKSVEINKGFFYYVKTGISGASITFINNDKSVIFDNVGMLGVDIFEKYTVDVLGNYSKVKHETRQPLHLLTVKEKEQKRKILKEKESNGIY